MDHIDIEMLQKLAALPQIAYDRVRITMAKALDIRPATLDKIVKGAQKAFTGDNETPFEIVEPWHEAISPVAILDEIAATIKRFIVCQPETITAVTLWITMTWFIDVIHVAPLAVITAPEKRCGKSQLLFLLSRLVNRPLAASNVTSAALFRSIDLWQPTLLIDEADTFLRENEELRGLINCGHTREGAFLVRTVGDDHTPKRFKLWGAKAIAGIGHLHGTLMDRAIILQLCRKKIEEQTERLRHADPLHFKILAVKLARFSADYSAVIYNAKPHLPDALHDRAQDNWEPLFAIADCADGTWRQLAQVAAIKISGDVDQSKSMGIELLSDIQEIITSRQTDRITTADLITALCHDHEKPWTTFNRGQSIMPRQIASRLREFGIISYTIRMGSITAKGYQFLQFADAFDRYLAGGWCKRNSVTS